MNTQTKDNLSTQKNQNIELKDDLQLLEIMLTDSKSQPPLYHPGPYWLNKAKNATNEIQRCGIADFRGSTNLIGLSYADNLYIDIRNAYNYGLKRLIRWLTMIYPLSKVYDSQVRWTESYAHLCITYAQEILNIKERSRNLKKIHHALFAPRQMSIKSRNRWT